jgi:phage shock protein A
MEARSQAAAELGGADLESQFAQLEAGSDIDSELEMMKAQLSGTSSTTQGQLPAGETQPANPQDQVVDAELEDLKTQLDQL